MLVIGCNGLGQIDVLAHHAGKLNTHAFQLKVPRSEAVLAQVIVLNVLKQAVVLLGGDLPLLPTRTKRVVLCLHNGRAVENVVAVAFDGQPPVLLVVRGVPLADLEVVGPLPGREQGRAPIQLAAGLGSRIRLVQFGEVGLDGAEIPVYPADERLVDDVGGNDEEFGMLSSGRDDGGNGGIFDIDLAAHVSSAILTHCAIFGLGSYNIVVHLDIHNVILYPVV